MSDQVQELLAAPGVPELFAALERPGEKIWLVGGCVRNSLLGEPADDLDFATQAEPRTIIKRAEAAGLRAIPTGLDHGTVTILASGGSFEVTTLRRDVETDGRHAVVQFATDIAEDSSRRDFTINALYLDGAGKLHDPQGGLKDLKARQVRFIGDAAARIEEDYLRILRFFRFYARYGGGPPDRDAIRAIVAKRSGLGSLSPERVWSELKKLLAAPNAERSLLWMRQSGVYQTLLPESGDMDTLPRLARLEKMLARAADPILRLSALLPRHGSDRINALSKRLRFSNAERDSLFSILSAADDIDAVLSDRSVTPALALYAHGEEAVVRAALLNGARSLEADPQLEIPDQIVEKLQSLIQVADSYVRPSLPVNGDDLLQRGIHEGPELGAALQYLEAAWKQSDFTLSRNDLLSVLKEPTRH